MFTRPAPRTLVVGAVALLGGAALLGIARADYLLFHALVEMAVVGIGVNISLSADELPVPTATSLALAGLSTDKTRIVAEIWREFAPLFRDWEAAGELHDSYSARCDSIGAPLRVLVDERTSVLGVGDHVDQFGRLVVRTDEGLRTFSAGDVFHLRKQ